MTAIFGLEELAIVALSLSPSLLALLIGAALCVRHASDQRRRATLIGLGLLIQVTNLGLMPFSGLVFQQLEQATGSIAAARVGLGLLHSLPSACTVLLFLYAAFYGDERLSVEDEAV
jgi:hypothetical protein